MLALTSKLPRTWRGVTLIEVVVVAAVASVIFIMLLRWLLTLSAVSTTTINNASTARQGAYLDVRFAADIASATGCDTPEASPIVRFTPTELSFYTSGPRNDGTSGTRLVTWTGQSTSITRSETPIDATTNGCNTSTAVSSGSTITTDTLVGDRLFTAIANNTAMTAPDDDCILLDSTPTGASCDATAVTLATTITSVNNESGAVAVNHTYTFPGRGSR